MNIIPLDSANFAARAATGLYVAERRIMDLRNRESSMRWVWVVLIGILVVAAAAGFVYCRARGHSGFNGRIEAVKGPFGVKIGVKIGCY